MILLPHKLETAVIPVATGWLLGSCMEARGKQDLWTRQKPEVLEALREQALIQSVESSNRIEGVTIAADRLRPVIIGNARPRDRSETELIGYRKALRWIFSRRQPVPIVPELIQRLHALAQAQAAGDAGEWKQRDNEIVEISPRGGRRVRFVPTSARDVPKAMKALCDNYAIARGDEKIPPLLIVATFVFDLLCIHPFRDGNGRVSRLVTTLMLLEHGFQVSRYVSLERLIEEAKEEYYQTLRTCSSGWHEGAAEIVPWWNYFLSILRAAYREFETRLDSIEARPAKSELVRQTVLAQTETFTLADLAAQLPSVSPQLIKKVLSGLKAEGGKIRLRGRGRGARWEVIGTSPD